MTATDALTSPVPEPFNVSLREAGGEGTALSVVGCPLSVVGSAPAEDSFAIRGKDRFAALFETQRYSEGVQSYTNFPCNSHRLSVEALEPNGQITIGQRTTDNGQSTFKVVLDAGHGGKDPGGMGKNSQEKHIALNIVRLLAIGIRTNFPSVEVILTRSDDTFIPLYERAKIANEEGADLFISVHANIMPGSSATYGTETFVMGQHVAKHNLAVAKRENASILLEENVKENYGYDPNSDEGHIMMSTFQHAFLERSILFADLVEGEFKSAGRKSRGVKQAGFVVLKNTTMPSVLVETGFMSNPKEEAYLLSGVGQQKLANALLKAFNNYLKMLDGGSTQALSPITKSYPTPKAATAPKTTVNNKKPASFKWQPLPQPQQPTTDNRQASTVSVFDREITPGNSRSTNPPPTARQWTAKGVAPQPISYYTPPKPKPVATAPQPAYGTPVPGYVAPTAPALPPRSEASKQYESVLSREVTNGLRAQPSVYQRSSRAVQPVAVVQQDSTPASGAYKFGQAQVREDKNRFDISTVSDTELIYAVQIVATKRTLDLTEARWKRISYPVRMVREGEWNKYQVRGLGGADDARSARDHVKAAGFPEAMVVVYYQGKRVAASQVKYLLSR